MQRPIVALKDPRPCSRSPRLLESRRLSKPLRWLPPLLCIVALLAVPVGARAADDNPVTDDRSRDERALLTGSVEHLPVTARQELERLFHQAGLKTVSVRSVERTPERQVEVMLALAEDDLERAKSMYCAAGDSVLEQFSAKRTRDENRALMLRTLMAELPRAREMGCLNHVENPQVVSVDVRLADVPAAVHDVVVKLAEAAVKQKRIARFLAPPREPDAFHFEFAKATGDGTNAASDSSAASD